MKNSDNKIVKYIARNSRFCKNSTMCKNLNYVLYKCNMDMYEIDNVVGKQFVNRCSDRWVDELLEDDFLNANLIRDLINVRDGYYDLMCEHDGIYVKLFDRDECTFLLNYLCTA